MSRIPFHPNGEVDRNSESLQVDTWAASEYELTPLQYRWAPLVVRAARDNGASLWGALAHCGLNCGHSVATRAVTSHHESARDSCKGA
ncbi:hypothetical protein GCM10025784_07790 [Citricoccus nitrophenolicus]